MVAARFTALLHLRPWKTTAPLPEPRTVLCSPATMPGQSGTRSPRQSRPLASQLHQSLTWDQGAEMASHAPAEAPDESLYPCQQRRRLIILAQRQLEFLDLSKWQTRQQHGALPLNESNAGIIHLEGEGISDSGC